MSLLLPHERKAFVQAKQAAPAVGSGSMAPIATTNARQAPPKARGLAIESEYA
jgi:hypothetical protein